MTYIAEGLEFIFDTMRKRTLSNGIEEEEWFDDFPTEEPALPKYSDPSPRKSLGQTLRKGTTMRRVSFKEKCQRCFKSVFSCCFKRKPKMQKSNYKHYSSKFGGKSITLIDSHKIKREGRVKNIYTI